MQDLLLIISVIRTTCQFTKWNRLHCSTAIDICEKNGQNILTSVTKSVSNRKEINKLSLFSWENGLEARMIFES